MFYVLLLSLFLIITRLMLVSHLKHIADEWKNVNMLFQIETNFITYEICAHEDGPAHLGIKGATLFT